MNHEQILLEHYLRLLEISRDLVSTLNIEELLHRIVNAAADLCDAEATSILLYDENRKVLSFEASTNMESPLMRGFSVPVDSSIAGWVVTNRQPVIIGDAQKDNRHYGVVGETVNLRTTSLMAVPLVTKEKVIGALEAINKKKWRLYPGRPGHIDCLRSSGSYRHREHPPVPAVGFDC